MTTEWLATGLSLAMGLATVTVRTRYAGSLRIARWQRAEQPLFARHGSRHASCIDVGQVETVSRTAPASNVDPRTTANLGGATRDTAYTPTGTD